MTTPTVSVCMPAYNAADRISVAIESVFRQTREDWELVIVDDASTDATAQVVGSQGDDRVRLYVNDSNLGQARASNRALHLARCELIKFLHHDDRLEPDCLARLAEPFELSPRVGFAFSRRRIELEAPDDPASRQWKAAHAEPHLKFGGLEEVNHGPALFERYLASGVESNWIGEPSCAMVRREYLRVCGTFNLRVQGLNDVDLWLRLMSRYDVGFVDAVLCTYRFGASGETGVSLRTGRDWLDTLWMLEGLATLTDVWVRFPGLERLRRREVVRRLRELAGLARLGQLDAHRVRDASAYASYRAQRRLGRSPPLLGSL